MSVLLYGSETWTLRKSDRDKLQAFHMMSQRWILGIKWYDRKTNISIQEKTGLTNLPVMLADRRHSLFGHICRLPPDVPAHRALKLCMEVTNGLTVLSKLLERLVAKQLVDYLTRSKLLPNLQSTYRAHHSTETAVLRVLSDILRAIDNGDLAMLTLLDLSAAFDTVDHATLLRRLELSYGIGGTVLNWFRSFLDDRTQYVRCGTSRSRRSSIQCGVPQGSVLSAILFLLYTADLLQLIERHQLRPHLYADDTQIYGICHPTSTTQLQNQASQCIDDVARWMKSNRLQLNTAKTEVLWCSSARRQHQVPQAGVRVGADVVLPSASVRNLGIYLDSDVSMRTHVARTVSGCFAVLRQLRSIRRSVTQPVMQTLTCRRAGVDPPRLWKRHVIRHHGSTTRQAAVRLERCSTAHFSLTEIRPRDAATVRITLVALPGEN